MLPGVMVMVTVLAFNFLGDGLRDAADPYSHTDGDEAMAPLLQIETCTSRSQGGGEPFALSVGWISPSTTARPLASSVKAVAGRA